MSVRAIPQISPQPLKAPLQPLLWAALAYGGGVVVGNVAWRPSTWWVVATLAFIGAGAYLVSRRRWLAYGLALGGLFFVGALAIQLRAHREPTYPRGASAQNL